MAKKQEHDTHFKLNYNLIDVAKAFLVYNLPKKILALLDISTLQVISNELLPSHGQTKKHADVIYSLKDKKGGSVYAIIQLEAQSSPDQHMAMRVWEYHVAAARAYLKREKVAKIPLILSFVIYNGQVEWSGLTCLADMFENFELYMEIWKMNFVVDMRKKSYQELYGQGAAAAPQMMMKGRSEGTFLKALPKIHEKMVEYEQDTIENIDYMLSHETKNRDEFWEIFYKLAPDKTNQYKNMLEAAKQEGILQGILEGKQEGILQGILKGKQEGILEGILKGKQEGILEGILKGKQEGILKGKQEAQLEVANNMLKNGFDLNTIAKNTGLKVAQIKALV